MKSQKSKEINVFIITKCIKNVFQEIFSSLCHLINFFKAVFLLNVETLTWLDLKSKHNTSYQFKAFLF